MTLRIMGILIPHQPCRNFELTARLGNLLYDAGKMTIKTSETIKWSFRPIGEDVNWRDGFPARWIFFPHKFCQFHKKKCVILVLGNLWYLGECLNYCQSTRKPHGRNLLPLSQILKFPALVSHMLLLQIDRRSVKKLVCNILLIQKLYKEFKL